WASPEDEAALSVTAIAPASISFSDCGHRMKPPLVRRRQLVCPPTMPAPEIDCIARRARTRARLATPTAEIDCIARRAHTGHASPCLFADCFPAWAITS